VELRRNFEIVNDQGLHARPCHSIVQAAMEHKSEIRVRCGEREANGKSILELMTLSACQGTELQVRIWGPDAESLMDKLESLFARGFGET
jgi:phosphocarrier protein